jgi:xanthine dehydrogenase YagS FAD-binding subunit
VKEARIVCGGVAPTPFRARAAEKALLGNGVDAAGAADAAVADALPLEQNGYKVPILRTLIRQALEELKS